MKNFLENFKKRDLILVLISVLALVILFVVVRVTRHQEQADQEALIEGVTETVETDNSAQTSVSSTASLVINEITSDGRVEIYNNSQKQVDLSGYSVYVGSDEVLSSIEDVQLDAGSFYIIETGKNFADKGNNVISIYDADNTIVKAIYFEKIDNGTSYGCITDGGLEMGYISSTAGESNDGGTVIPKDEICFSVPSGFYDNAFSLTISAPDNCTIYYTVDGSEPTTESDKYTSSIDITRPSGTSYIYATSDGNGYTYSSFAPEKVDMGTVVKAIAVDDSGEIVYSNTASYYIGYGKDADYVGLPVITIEVDPEEMFGFESGIYVPGKSYYEGYIQNDNAQANYLTRNFIDIQMEYYEVNKDRTYTTSGTISIYNDQRRGEEQKAFVIKTSDVYPDGTSMDDYLNDSSNSLLLLSGGGDNSTKIRNYLVNELVDGTDVIKRDYTPCIVFINGEYWGLYTLATNYDAHYFEEKYGVTEEVITVESEYGVADEYTSFYNYVVNTDFSNEANYEQLDTMMDISNYIEFMCTNIYIGNTTMWRNESACVWKTVNGNGQGYSDNRWRWALNNVDSTLGNTNSYIDPYTKGDYSAAIINTYLSAGIKNNAFFNSLLKSDLFAEEYLDTMNRLIENNFTQEHAIEILTNLDSKISNAVAATNLRFKGVETDLFRYDVNMLSSYFDTRTKYLTDYTDEYISLKGNVPGLLSNSDTTQGSSETQSEAISEGAEITEGAEIGND